MDREAKGASEWKKIEGKAGVVMKYEKPRIVFQGSTMRVIQSGIKALAFVWDSFHVITTGAYEADE